MMKSTGVFVTAEDVEEVELVMTGCRKFMHWIQKHGPKPSSLTAVSRGQYAVNNIAEHYGLPPAGPQEDYYIALTDCEVHRGKKNI